MSQKHQSRIIKYGGENGRRIQVGFKRPRGGGGQNVDFSFFQQAETLLAVDGDGADCVTAPQKSRRNQTAHFNIDPLPFPFAVAVGVSVRRRPDAAVHDSVPFDALHIRSRERRRGGQR